MFWFVYFEYFAVEVLLLPSPGISRQVERIVAERGRYGRKEPNS